MFRLLQSLGFIGSLFAAACCLGLPFVIAGATAWGAGFLIRDRCLLPLLALFLAISVAGTLSFRKHGRKAPLSISIAGAALTFGGIFLRPAIAYAGITMLLLASVLDPWAARNSAEGG